MYSRRWQTGFIVLIMVVLLILQSTAFLQDAPTDIPFEIPTDTPTDIPTPKIVPPETPITPQLLSTSEIGWVLLARDDFENGDLSQWSLPSGWSLAQTDSGQALTFASAEAVDAPPADYLQSNLANAAVEARFQWQSGSVRLSLRGYMAVMNADGGVSLFRAGALWLTGIASPSGNGRTLRLSLLDGTAAVFVDGILALSATDTAPLPPGTVSLGGSQITQMRVDDFALFAPQDSTPLESGATPIPSAEATAVPPEVIFAPTETPLTYLLESDFEDEITTGWFFDKTWQRVAVEGGHALQVTTHSSSIAYGNLYSVVIEAKLLGSGNVRLRDSALGSYTLHVEASGGIALLRDDSVVAIGAFAPSTTWINLRVTALDHEIKASVNGMDVLSFTDDTPLPPGTVSFAAALGQFLLDDVKIWMAASEVNTLYLMPPPEVTAEATAESTPEIALIVPADNAILNNPRPRLRWRPVNGATGYRIQIAMDRNFTAPQTNDLEATATSFTIDTLAQGRYWWRVAARDAALNWGQPSAGVSFIVQIGIAPVDGSVVITPDKARLTFHWTPVESAHYRVEIARDVDFTDIVHLSDDLSDTQYRLPVDAELTYGRYYWRINIVGQDAISLVYKNLIVSPTLPDTPIIPNTTPLTSAVANPTMIWNAVTYNFGPVTYDAQVDNDSNFSSPEFACTGTDDVTQIITRTLPPGRYLWRVRAVNQYGAASHWSEAREIELSAVTTSAILGRQPTMSTWL